MSLDYIAIKDLSFTYPNSEKMILGNIQMQVSAGEFVCVLGQSGCGKSTFLRLLGGLEKPTTGSIAIKGKEIAGASLDRGIVFQDYGLFPWMTAGENIMLALRQKFPKEKQDVLKQTALSMLKAVGLDETIYKKLPKELSGGMKQRCAIAQAFSINPPILLMDEPFGALDAVTRARLQDLVLFLWSKEEKPKTVFFVTHDVDEALLLANRIVVFGQSPSNIIYECVIPPQDRPTRQNQFDNQKIMKLRNILISQINKDVSIRMG